ncbi:MAG: hypothetical protein IPK68_10100 [Bdellovibrionales bacterium]|nr:hypothetical protein [Bdellovibrionales bacterium]
MIPNPPLTEKARTTFDRQLKENLKRFRTLMFNAVRAEGGSQSVTLNEREIEKGFAEDAGYELKVEGLIDRLFGCWLGCLNQLLSKSIDDENASYGARNLILILMRLSRHFIEPDKPTGIGSRSNTGEAFTDTVMPVVEKIEKQLGKLVADLEKGEWAPISAILPLSMSEMYVREGVVKLREVIRIGINKSKTEDEAHQMLSDQFGVKTATAIINALISDLREIGFKLNQNAAGWSDRVRHRRSPTTKKSHRRPMSPRRRTTRF